jgi:ketosteroid isomerase-like protein
MSTEPVPSPRPVGPSVLDERPDRIALVRFGFERFNEKDLDSVLGLCTEDVEWPDVVNGTVLHGGQAIRDYFARIFAIATPLVTVGDVIEIADAVLATVYQQFYDLDGRLLGDPRVVVNRFTFRGDLVSAMTLTSQDDIPHELRQRVQDAQRSAST